MILKSDWTYYIRTIKGKQVITIPTDHTFFGIDHNHKIALHNIIFDMLYESEGMFTFSDLYNMPISLRLFYIDKLNKKIAEKNKKSKK